MEKHTENNSARLVGTIIEELKFSHSVLGEKFFETKICVQRKSENTDIIPVIISERIMNGEQNWYGKKAWLYGQFRSHNADDGNRRRLFLQFFVQEWHFADDEKYDKNDIALDGYIVKSPIYRETPSGYRICDLLIAVNRNYAKSDYIPCIAWGRTAVYAATLDVGTRIRIDGRIKSREYEKKLSETETEKRTAYEVSVLMMEVVDENSND